MSPKTASTFRIDDELLAGLRQVKDRDGIPQSEQIRRAILMWLESKSVTLKAAPRRAVTRRKA
jgi:Ribbon-helix-helix protein, copG family